MPEIAVNALPPDLQSWAVRAREAAKGDDTTVLAHLCQKVLAAEPRCLVVRRLWFEVRIQQGEDRSGRWFRRVRRFFASRRRATTVAREGTGPAWTAADGILAADFHRPQGWRQLAAVARAEDLVETERYVWSCAQRVCPHDGELGLAAAKALLELRLFADAATAVDGVLTHHPQDASAAALRQEILVAQTMAAGNWEQADGYRDKLRDRTSPD